MKFLFHALWAAVLGLATAAAAAEEVAPTKEEIRGYTGVGRIKWRIPTGPEFRCGFKVPHFTQGARVGCGSEGTEAEINVYSRDLIIDPLTRRDKFVEEMERMLGEAKETSVEVRTHGSSPAIVYATLTHRDPKTRRPRLTLGYYSKGPFLLRFSLESSDASDRDLERLFGMMLAADPLDAVPMLAWKLSDYKSICEGLFPAAKQANDAAFAASMFAGLDWLRHFQERDKEHSPPEKIAESFRKARDDLAGTLAGESAEERQRFCGAFPAMAIEAERGLPGGRRRGVVGITVYDLTPERARASGLPEKGGAEVYGVSPDGPASRAGIRAGDVIVRLAGKEIASSDEVVRAIISAPAGSRLEFVVARGAERLSLPVTSAEAPD